MRMIRGQMKMEMLDEISTGELEAELDRRKKDYLKRRRNDDMGTGGRYRTQHSYGHYIQFIGWDTWRTSWTVDRYYKGCRLRFPTTYRRDTDKAGAIRFCKKWGIPIESVEGLAQPPQQAGE